MSLCKKIRIASLKRKAVFAYTRYHEICDSYDCGNTLVEEISTEACLQRGAFNRTMRQLRQLDPTALKNLRL